MKSLLGGGLLALLAAGAPADELTVTRDDGTRLAVFDMPPEGTWCVHWNHSVQGFAVRDCYENRAGAMVLVRSHLPDFAAGLDHIPGRGRQVSDGQGGYWIEDLDEPVAGNAYVLRAGAATVDHRIVAEGIDFSLSAAAPRQPLTIALED